MPFAAKLKCISMWWVDNKQNITAVQGRLEIRNFSSRVEKYFTHSLCSLMKYFQHSKRNFISPHSHVTSLFMPDYISKFHSLASLFEVQKNNLKILSQTKSFRNEIEMLWYVMGIYIIKRTLHLYMAAWRYEISLLLLKNISLICCAHS